MKIVALDIHTVDFDGLSLDPLERLGELKKFERTLPEELVGRGADAEALIVNKFVLGARELERLPKLRYVGVCATGYNNVDVAACRARGVAVTNVAGYSTDSVAQLVIAYILNHYARVSDYHALVLSGEWSASEDFAVPRFSQGELAEKVIGIVGFGTIGKRVAEIASAFRMEVRIAQLPGRPAGQGRIPLEELLPELDVLTLHCPLTPDTEHLINARTLALLPRTAIVVNTSRGKVVDEAALASALNANRLAGAFVDVLSAEPPPRTNPLLSASNAVITPHIAWATLEARRRLVRETAENLAAFQRGERRNRVD